MTSTQRQGQPRRQTGARWWLAGVLALLGAQQCFAAADVIPRPPELERDVQFWVRVYTEVTTNGGILHDENNLGVVYDIMRFAPNTAPRERQRLIDESRERIQASLRRLATGTEPLTQEDQRIKEMWGTEGNASRWTDATNRVRFQLGQSDRFRAGLVRSGAWQTHIAETIANLGLPAELAVLPHVESSFNPAAYSKVGAAGLWQFMRSTGRRYMRIDNVVDERMDPFRSTEAAAQLLSYNYRLLGTWPLALTAYNHGAAGMRRAKEAQGTDDIAKIVRYHKSPSFGFASRNFYVSFLAALEIDHNPEKYFGAIERQAETKFQEVAMPAYVTVSSLERVVKVSRETLRELNPGLLSPVWRGESRVPKGYRLRLPTTGDEWTSELLAQRLAPTELYAGQPAPKGHRVRRGETLSSLARRYGVSTRALAEANDLKIKAKLRIGQNIEIPQTVAKDVVVAAAAAEQPPEKPSVVAAPTPAPAAVAKPTPGIYTVRRGESLGEISNKVGLTEAELLKLNKIRNPNFIFEGQRLLLAASETAAEVAAANVTAEEAPAEAPTSGPRARRTPTRVAVVTPPTPEAGLVSAAVAERESDEDAAAVAAIAKKPPTSSQPVSGAQADAIGPALGPSAETTETADPNDYSVGKDNTISVAAAETIGHYADWLGVSAGRLREVNKMKYGRPVLIGHRVKLDFSKVKRDAFEAKRRDYHRNLQAAYFAAHRIVGTEVYLARRGDSLWTVTQRFERLPVWLLQQYNPDVDFASMRAGTQIVVPRVEEVVATGG